MLYMTLFNFIRNYSYREISLRQKIDWMYEVTDIILFMHNKNYVYCDFKLENIMLKESKPKKGKKNLKIIDFGSMIDYSEN